jgi:hypothetical protein
VTKKTPTLQGLLQDIAQHPAFHEALRMPGQEAVATAKLILSMIEDRIRPDARIVVVVSGPLGEAVGVAATVDADETQSILEAAVAGVERVDVVDG